MAHEEAVREGVEGNFFGTVGYIVEFREDGIPETFLGMPSRCDPFSRDGEERSPIEQDSQCGLVVKGPRPQETREMAVAPVMSSGNFDGGAKSRGDLARRAGWFSHCDAPDAMRIPRGWYQIAAACADRRHAAYAATLDYFGAIFCKPASRLAICWARCEFSKS